MNIALWIINDCFNNPLMSECREAGCFVEQFMYVLVCPVRFHLEVCDGKRLFQKLSQKFSQIVDMWFDFFSRWNSCWWNGITGSWCGRDGRRSRQKSLSALFLLLYRVFYSFNYILTSRNRIFILKSIKLWCNKSVKPVSIQFVTLYFVQQWHKIILMDTIWKSLKLNLKKKRI